MTRGLCLTDDNVHKCKDQRLVNFLFDLLELELEEEEVKVALELIAKMLACKSLYTTELCHRTLQRQQEGDLETSTQTRALWESSKRKEG